MSSRSRSWQMVGGWQAREPGDRLSIWSRYYQTPLAGLCNVLSSPSNRSLKQLGKTGLWSGDGVGC